MTGNGVVRNSIWMIACKVIQSLLQLVIGMISARYLGPSGYGLLGYAASVVGFALPLAQLGLQATIIQEFVESPEDEGRILGTSLVLEGLGSLVSMGLVAAFVALANAGETVTLIVCVLYSLSLLTRSLEILQCWFQHKLKSKYPSVVMLCSYAVASAYKIFLLATGQSIYWFALVNALDYALTGAALLVIYRKLGAQKLRFDAAIVAKLLSRSRYYILAAMMVTVFQNTDHVMLKMMSGDAANGFYTAAVTCASVCQFVYTAITDSARPVILRMRRENYASFEKYVSYLYCIITYLSLAQSAAFTLLARPIVLILYGADYTPAVPVLRVLVWYLAFSFMGIIRNIWILAEGKQSMLWKINLCGALMNALVNALLIPCYGALGAAAASCATQLFTNFVLGFMIRDIRPNNRLLLRGLDVRLIGDMIKTIRKKN